MSIETSAKIQAADKRGNPCSSAANSYSIVPISRSTFWTADNWMAIGSDVLELDYAILHTVNKAASAIHKAEDLSPEQKTVIESLLGHRVQEGEAVSVRAFEVPAVSDVRREQITQRLRRYFAEVDARRRDVSAAETGDIIDEAIRSTRPHYRPYR